MSGSPDMPIRTLTWALVLVAVCGPTAVRGMAQDAPPPEQAKSLLDNLHAENVDGRRKAATNIGTSDRKTQRAALPVMIELLAKEKDGQVRLAVLDALAILGPDAATAVPALIQTLRTDVGGRGSEASHQDYRAALALAAIGKPAVEGLRGLLKEGKVGVRAESAMALGRIGADADAAVPDLIVLLGEKNERVRREASIALGHIGTAAALPLVAASARGDAIIRASAVEGMAYLTAPTDEVNAAVLKCARDAAPAVRAAATKSLARLKLTDDALLPVLEENVRHDDDQVRLAVVNLLVARRTLFAPISPVLESLLTVKNDRVARHAAYLLGMSGPGAAGRLLNALHHESSRIDQIAEALAQIGRPVAPLLTQAVKSPDPRVRRGAALALGQIRPLAAGTVPALTASLDEPDPIVKASFLTAIGYLGSRASESVPKVRTLLHDNSPEIRTKTIQILAQSAPRDERLVSDLIVVLDDSDAGVQHQAIDILRSLGPPARRALPGVIGKLNSKDPDVRFAAAEMIGSHGPAAAEAVPALSTLLDDPAPKIRTIAAVTLGMIGKQAQPALARLTTLLGAEQVEVREAATSTLGSLELDAEVIRPHLARALRDQKSEVRRAATKAIQRLGPDGAIFIPDIILMAENKENLRSVERMLRRFERLGPDVRSLPELVKHLEHKQDSVRLLAIKYLRLAGQSAKDALPALERMRDDPSAEVRKQAEAASQQIKKSTGAADQKKVARNERQTGSLDGLRVQGSAAR
jgi:HEAT repeat protein